MKTPTTTLDTLADWGTNYLTQVIAIDSQSDESSETIPSSEGQRRLSAHLAEVFGAFGFATEQDDYANLIVTVPATEGLETTPALALMVHVDTAEGTLAVPQLVEVTAWDGGIISYPENSRLTVSAEHYAETRYFVGEDVLHGPGTAPVGLDDKLGMAELMTLARLLSEEDIPHGPVLLVFRPDEEIGRMAAVEGLAVTLKDRGVRFGYTIDGLTPFEINVENFNASRGDLEVPRSPVDESPARCLRCAVYGVKSHGATAKAEGYLNAILIVSRALADLGPRDDVQLSHFETNSASESDAEVVFALFGDVEVAEGDLRRALDAQIAPHAGRGAHLVVEPVDSQPADTGLAQILALVGRFVVAPGVSPILSEDSEESEGYSNPYALRPVGDGWGLSFRLRAFDEAELRAREAHLQEVVESGALASATLRISQQYVNMGPVLADYPELVDYATAALVPLGEPAVHAPIRGGTGVDPFLDQGIPVANLGTGYFAPESEKELTSRQNIARHALWLTYLVQAVAATG